MHISIASFAHASARHRPGSLVGDALSLLRDPAILGSWLHASRLAEMLAGVHAPHRAGKRTQQIANELRSKLLPPARIGLYPDIEVKPGSYVRAIALAGIGAPVAVPGSPRPLTRHERLQGLLAGIHLMLGDAVYLPPGDRGRHVGLRGQLTLALPSLGHAAADRSLAQIDVVVLRDGRLFRAYEVETVAGKATKALVRLSDVFGTVGQLPGGIAIAVPDAQVDLLQLELERPTLRGLLGVARILPFSDIEDPLGP
ncbi:hypothetical protein [Azospirillum argentinense]